MERPVYADSFQTSQNILPSPPFPPILFMVSAGAPLRSRCDAAVCKIVDSLLPYSRSPDKKTTHVRLSATAYFQYLESLPISGVRHFDSHPEDPSHRFNSGLFS
jgi:hypothetical protein